jgi:uridine phosphorylase
MTKIKTSELFFNPDKSIYHLSLHPEEIAGTVLLVGDHDRVDLISSFFDHIELKKQHREFRTHTGTYKGKRISAVSTGIGTDNIDIVLVELDTLLNIDFQKMEEKQEKKSFNFIRIGTCGALQDDIEPGTAVLTTHALGFDNLLNFYQFENSIEETSISNSLEQWLEENDSPVPFYLFSASENLKTKFSMKYKEGITASCPGFYGPQGRRIRLALKYPKLIENLSGFRYNNHRIINFEMESSALYGLSRLLGHNALTIDLVVANRLTQKTDTNYKENMRKLIWETLENLNLII